MLKVGTKIPAGACDRAEKFEPTIRLRKGKDDVEINLPRLGCEYFPLR